MDDSQTSAPSSQWSRWSQASWWRRFPWWVYVLALLCVCGGLASVARGPQDDKTDKAALIVAGPVTPTPNERGELVEPAQSFEQANTEGLEHSTSISTFTF